MGEHLQDEHRFAKMFSQFSQMGVLSHLGENLPSWACAPTANPNPKQ